MIVDGDIARTGARFVNSSGSQAKIVNSDEVDPGTTRHDTLAQRVRVVAVQAPHRCEPQPQPTKCNEAKKGTLESM